MISCGIKSETCAFLLGPFLLPWKRTQHYHPMQMRVSWKQMLQCNCTNYLTFFFLKNSLLMVCSWRLSFPHFFSGFRHVWNTACLSNPVKSNKWDNTLQVMQLKAWIILHEQLSKCPLCIYILAAPPYGFLHMKKLCLSTNTMLTNQAHALSYECSFQYKRSYFE